MKIKDKLHQARAYPYDFPPFSYVYDDGEVTAFEATLTQGRLPILAFASNRAPVQLLRKFGHLDNQLIPVEQVKLCDFDVVFAAHITSYEALPAMLQYCPDVVVSVAITWLDQRQLQIMHRSELYAANYSFAELDTITIIRKHGTQLDKIYAYIGESGHYSPPMGPAHPVSISAIEAQNRKWPGNSTAELLSRLHQQLKIATSEETFILRLIDDKSYRRSISARISRQAPVFNYPYKIITHHKDL